MSFADLPPHIRDIANTQLTPRQLAAYKLWEEGLGYRRIATILNISTSAARDRINRALRAIELALERAA